MTFLSQIDHLRPPSILDPQSAIAKDWWHVNVFDHRKAMIGIINTSLHGDPNRKFGLAVGCTLFHQHSVGWCGGVEVREMARSNIDAIGIGLAHSAISVRLDGVVDVSARLPDVKANIAAHPTGRRIEIEDRMPFGSGWISWRAIPRMDVSGSLSVGGEPSDPNDLRAYHDHNWGRWFWGDDAGWEWATFAANDAGPTIVFARTTKREHRAGGLPKLVVQTDDHEWRCRARSITCERLGSFHGELLRLPGAMAALRSDRRRPKLPEVVRIEANDGNVNVAVELRVEGAAQIICADPAGGGHGFVHELCGPMSYRFSTPSRSWRGEGLGVFEHVD